MTIYRVFRATGLVALSAIALPFGSESGSAAEPDATAESAVAPSHEAQRDEANGRPKRVMEEGGDAQGEGDREAGPYLP